MKCIKLVDCYLNASLKVGKVYDFLNKHNSLASSAEFGIRVFLKQDTKL